MQYWVLYNPLAGKGKKISELDTLNKYYKNDQLTYVDMTKIVDYQEFFAKIPEEEGIILCGGDGTLQHFIRKIRKIVLTHRIFYFAMGTGNDFTREITQGKSVPILINKYLENLPIVVINGEEYPFINGVGFGIDGYCCEEGDKQREKSKKKVDYTSIAIKGLLYDYKPTDAEVIVDGKSYQFKNVWLAPTMFGRYYGGGMMPAPKQNRELDTLSVTIAHSMGKIKTLMMFPSFFTGEVEKYSEGITVLVGKEITVKFKEPRSLQIDGETIINVMEYTARR